MKKKMLAILATLFVLFSTIASTFAAADPPDVGLHVVEVEKKIWDANNDSWVDELNVNVDDVVRFNISITYNKIDPIAYKLKWITIIDTLPPSLEYAYNATIPETAVSIDGRSVIWSNLTGIEIYDGESFYLEFDVNVTSQGTHVNTVNVSGYETCPRVWHYAEAEATVYVSETEDDVPPEIEIVKPKIKSFYFGNKRLFPLPNIVFIIGPIDITANATDNEGVERVEFYIDNVLRRTVATPPYKWKWLIGSLFKPLKLKHTIKVIAYDNAGNNNSAERDVLRWRFHPILAAGIFSVAFKMLEPEPEPDEPKEKPKKPNQVPNSDAGGPYNAYINEIVEFDGSASSDFDGTIVSYVWDFGDGSTGTGESPTHTYTVAGEYTVTLTVTDDDGTKNTYATKVTIYESKNGGDNNIFWYIVGGLSALLLTALVGLFIRRKYYE